ncbi:MAG: hypothetical protein HPY53_02390 [Brevinematales bacterium]|nr:hypothetical protein [Brevinematales bacterium]
MIKKFGVLSLLVSLSNLVFAEGLGVSSGTILNSPAGKNYQVRLNAEFGMFGIINHTIQFGKTGSQFNYLTEGNQDVLYAFQRYSVEFILAKQHEFILLYQPLELNTLAVMSRDVKIENIVFTNGEVLNLTYGFPFYRFSYMYDFDGSDNTEIALGLSLQLRDATILFNSVNTSKAIVSQNVGPVPIIKFRWTSYLADSFYLGTEIDGFYASSSFFNGSDVEFEGWIYDASIRAGLTVGEFVHLYMNVRFLGGGATGTEKNRDYPGDDGFTDNKFHTFAITLGMTVF